jgi:hypothetical protein
MSRRGSGLGLLRRILETPGDRFPIRTGKIRRPPLGFIILVQPQVCKRESPEKADGHLGHHRPARSARCVTRRRTAGGGEAMSVAIRPAAAGPDPDRPAGQEIWAIPTDETYHGDGGPAAHFDDGQQSAFRPRGRGDRVSWRNDGVRAIHDDVHKSQQIKDWSLFSSFSLVTGVKRDSMNRVDRASTLGGNHHVSLKGMWTVYESAPFGTVLEARIRRRPSPPYGPARALGSYVGWGHPPRRALRP